MTDHYGQTGHRLRFEWGPVGAEAVGKDATIVAVVDVLSFTTSLNVAVEKGIEVFPYRWKDDSAHAFAQARDAALAGRRSDPISLSPANLRRAQGISRLVLPSPNGSAISHLLGAQGCTVIGVCLRNAGAAAQWAYQHAGGGVIAAVAAGERWRGEGSLRPSFEDLVGAGMFLDGLVRLGLHGTVSPEAQLALAAYRQSADRLPELLRDCSSGRELINEGYPEDVEVAAEVNASTVVPVLAGESFVAALP